MIKILLFLKYSGLWIPIPLFTFISYFFKADLGITLTPSQYLALGIGCHLPALYVYSQNQIAESNGTDRAHMSLLPSSKDSMYQPSERMRHLHKRPPKELLMKRPEGILFGLYDGGYVGADPGRGAAHTLITAQTGAGKTVTIISTLLAIAGGYIPDTSVICVDAKDGELERKGFVPGSKGQVFNPQNRSKYGFDFFYDINEKSSSSEVVNALRRVVYSLIPMKESVKDPFWIQAPRSVLLGLFIYAWTHEGLSNLPDLADFVCSRNLKALINEVVADTDDYSVEHKLLAPFSGKDAAAETLSGIAMNISNAINLLVTDESLRFLLREKKEKIKPIDIEDGYNIIIQISDSELDKFSNILNLCLSTCCDYLSKRGENPRQKCLLLVDEMGRICSSSGQIPGVKELLQVGRSRGTTVTLLLQSWAVLDGIYSKGALTDMLTNLPYRLILQAQPDDKETVDMVQRAFGKYLVKKRSYSCGKSSSVSFNYEDKEIITGKDLLTLPKQDKAILLSPYGACMITKIKYYKDPILKKISKKCIRA